MPVRSKVSPNTNRLQQWGHAERKVRLRSSPSEPSHRQLPIKDAPVRPLAAMSRNKAILLLAALVLLGFIGVQYSGVSVALFSQRLRSTGQSSATNKQAQNNRPRPNILFLMSDQHRWDSLGIVDSAVVETPHLDRLSREGTRFEAATTYVPTCVPARAAILTGSSAEDTMIRTGSDKDPFSPSDRKTFLQLLAANGYIVEYYGKYHNHVNNFVAGNAITNSSWGSSDAVKSAFESPDEMMTHYNRRYAATLKQHMGDAIQGAPLDDGERHTKSEAWDFPWTPRVMLSNKVLDSKNGIAGKGTNRERYKNWAMFGTQKLPVQESFSMFTANETVNALNRYHDKVLDGGESANRRRRRRRQNAHPFCFFVSFFKPHPPIVGSLSLFLKYAHKGIPVPTSLTNDSMHLSTGGFNELLQDFLARHPGAVKNITRLYYASVEEVDAGIGAILQALDRLGLADDTVVFYTSDHGEMLGSHGLLGKSNLYDEAIRVPFIFRYPNVVPAGRLLPTPVTTLDIAPTFLALSRFTGGDDASIPVDTLKTLGMQGRELISTMQAASGGTKVRNQQWKLVFDFQLNKSKCLFSLTDDPFELNNLLENQQDGSGGDTSLAIQEAQRTLQTHLFRWLSHVRSTSKTVLADPTWKWEPGPQRRNNSKKQLNRPSKNNSKGDVRT